MERSRSSGQTMARIDLAGAVSSPHFSHSMLPALFFGEADTAAGGKSVSGYRVSRPTSEMPADQVTRRAG